MADRAAAASKARVERQKAKGEGLKPKAEGQQGTAVRLDRLIHERLRLGIVSALAVNDRLTFNDLKRLLATTDGNLSVHARKLEDAGYVACDSPSTAACRRTRTGSP